MGFLPNFYKRAIFPNFLKEKEQQPITTNYKNLISSPISLFPTSHSSPSPFSNLSPRPPPTTTTTTSSSPFSSSTPLSPSSSSSQASGRKERSNSLKSTLLNQPSFLILENASSDKVISSSKPNLSKDSHLHLDQEIPFENAFVSLKYKSSPLQHEKKEKTNQEPMDRIEEGQMEEEREERYNEQYKQDVFSFHLSKKNWNAALHYLKSSNHPLFTPQHLKYAILQGANPQILQLLLKFVDCQSQDQFGILIFFFKLFLPSLFYFLSLPF